jgi:competence protein ComEA
LIQLERKQQLILLIMAGVILFSGGYRFAQVKLRPAEKPVLETQELSKVKILNVHVTGAVSKPGVYQLPADARIIDAVNKAAPMDEADLDALKLAARIADGQDIYVPQKLPLGSSPAVGNQPGTAFPSAGSGNSAFSAAPGNSAAVNGLVNINTADQGQLDTLPGIGSSLAQRIIQYRDSNGPFKDIEDLKDVSGIGDKNFENLKDMITVY